MTLRTNPTFTHIHRHAHTLLDMYEPTRTPTVDISCPQTQDLGSHKPSVKATLIVFPPPSPSVKPRGSSHPRPLLCAHLLCWTARLAGETRGRSGARRSGYLALERLGGWRLDGGGVRCLRAVCGLPWRYCLTVFTTFQ